MFKFILPVLSLLFVNVSMAESLGFEGRSAALILEFKGLTQNKDILIASATIKSSEFSTGLYFEPKNKDLLLEVPKNCERLTEMAFANGFKYVISGELKKFDDNLMTPNEVAFNEKNVRCDVVKVKNQ